ncbi:MAG: ABC transporter permease [Candidatus Bathyarchaeia archaeon]|jgi:ABC-type dipeptide/oligopeptide/nickel transport system permease component
MASLIRYIIRRLLFMIPVFLGVAILTFAVGNAAGNPINLIRAGLRNPNPAVLKALTDYYHLDQPVWERFLYWLWDLVHGNLGVSISGRPVLSQIGPWTITTLELQILAMILSVAIGVPVGVFSSKHQYSKADYAITSTAIFGYSMPTFWLGIMLIVIFSLDLGWLPSSGAVSVSYPWWGNSILDPIAHLILPTAVLTYVELATIVRLVRANMLEVMRQDYILAARASGLSERTVTYRYALRNAISPIITIIGLGFGAAMAGAPALETTFSWPGLGYAFAQAASTLDIPLVEGITIVITVMVMIANLMTDLVYAMIDPRVTVQ